MEQWRVLIVDDHPLMRRGITQLLACEPEFQDIEEASNGTDAVAICAHDEEPDLILLDLNMKGMSGLDTLKAMRSEGVSSTVVILTVSDNKQDVAALIKAGADGYLLKDTEPDELVELLKQALRGGKAYSETVRHYLEEGLTNASPFENLTEREMQILKEVAQGYRNKQIADRLFISESTVKVHMKSLLKKLGVNSRVAATLQYLEYEDLNSGS
ncbi:response regulator [Parasalinivibrio latis]|uniref:response regulator n=1 Tax=Parasalinivibrio latis TaxID=2952610 RepID=UPI0030DF46D3